MTSFAKFPRRTLRPAFSLIEMVTVIAILVILMTAGVGLLNGTGSQSRKAGTDMLSGMIEQARTSAITSRSDVLLAIAEPGDIPGMEDRYRIGLFRMRKPVTGSTTTGERYDLIARWQTLNTGIVLLPGAVDGVRNLMDEKDKTSIVYGPSNKEITIKVRAISINSRGKLTLPTGSDPILFRIAEGGYRNGEAKANIRAGAKKPTENILKVGRVTARPYRID